MNIRSYYITPTLEVLAQGNRGDAALLGNDWSFSLCWSMWSQAAGTLQQQEKGRKRNTNPIHPENPCIQLEKASWFKVM